jgi:hypothetical protein
VRTHHKRGLERLRVELDRRHGGDRESWAALLAPLAKGSVAAKPMVKAGVAAAAVVVCAWTLHRVGWSARDARTDPNAIAVALERDRDAHVDASLTAEETSSVPELATEVARPAPPRAAANVLEMESLPVRIHGILVDSQTSDPVPDCSFEIVHAGRVDTMHSDMLGRFSSDAFVDSGELIVRTVDDDIASAVGRGTVVEHRASTPGVDDEIRLPVLVGPSYRLRLVGASGVDPESCEAALLALDTPWQRPMANVRAGTIPWVRFPLWSNIGSPKSRIEIRSRDQLWAGSAEVDASDGSHGIVEVRMSARGRLVGTILDPDGEPVAQANVCIAAAGSDSIERAIASDSSGGNGRYVLGCLRPGTYALHVTSDRFAAFETAVDVAAGRDQELDVTLGHPVAMVPVRGIVRSQSGRFDGQRIVVSLIADGARPRSATVKFETRGGADVGTFSFDAVPRGEYTLRMPRLAFDWAPPTAQVVAPSNDLELVYLDLEPTQDLALEVVDRETGARLAAYALYVDLANRATGASGADPASQLLQRIPRTRPIRFCVTADGYMPFSGDGASFGPRRDVNPLRIELERGWGASFRVEDLRMRPIAGARVILDRELAGTTDATGTLVVRRAAPPVRASVEADGFEFEWGGVDPSSGSLSRNSDGTVYVSMRPR